MAVRLPSAEDRQSYANADLIGALQVCPSKQTVVRRDTFGTKPAGRVLNSVIFTDPAFGERVPRSGVLCSWRFEEVTLTHAHTSRSDDGLRGPGSGGNVLKGAGGYVDGPVSQPFSNREEWLVSFDHDGDGAWLRHPSGVAPRTVFLSSSPGGWVAPDSES